MHKYGIELIFSKKVSIMNKEPYGDYKKRDMILRDWLASDRTVLANERTFLAYVRTALAVFVVGATFEQFFTSQLLKDIGILMLPVGIVLFFVGIYKYIQIRDSLRHLSRKRPKFYKPDISD
jgi:putative membrane protein